jgi:hypothetical protein
VCGAGRCHSVYLVDGDSGARIPASLAAVHVNGAQQKIAAVLPSSNAAGFAALPIVFSYVSDSRYASVVLLLFVTCRMRRRLSGGVFPSEYPPRGVVMAVL